MAHKFKLASTSVAALVAAVLILFTGPGAQAAAACGSTAIAHRGAWTPSIDENTLRAIERAHKLGAYTENDVFLTLDGRFVIIHNRSLRPTTNCTGYVTDRRLADIQQHCHTTPNSMWIPSAFQAFKKLAGNRGQLMNLEVKGPGWYKNDNAKVVALRNAAKKAGVLKRVFFSNDTTYRLLRAFRDSAPSARTAWKPDGHDDHVNVRRAKRLSVDAVMARSSQWSSKTKVRHFKRAGFRVWARLANHKRAWTWYWRHGIKAQLTNTPGAYRKWCRSVG